MDAKAAARRALEASRDDLAETATRWSSGSTSLQQLRQEGHPYAKRHGAPGRDPGLINDQGGPFADAWELGEVEDDGDTLSLTAENAAPEAEFLDEGTKTMFSRPLPERVEADVMPRLEKRLERELEREFRR